MQSSGIRRRAFLTTAVGTTAAAIGCNVNTSQTEGASKCDGQDDAAVRPRQSEGGIDYAREIHKSDLMEGFPPPKDKRVTIDNWTCTPARVRWTHLNANMVFKSMSIDKGNGPVWVLPRKMLDRAVLERQTVLWGTAKNDAEEIKVSDWLRRSQTDAFLVLHKGHIIAEQYFGDMTSSTRHLLCSASKTVLATALAPLLASGELDGSADVTEYIPELQESGFNGATVRQLLDMQTGIRMPAFPTEKELEELGVKNEIEWRFATPEFRRAKNIFARLCRAQGVVRPLADERNTGYYDFLCTLKQDRDHGEYFYYTDPNSMALQWILERQTRKSYVQHLRDLFQTLGFECDGTIVLDNIGTSVSTIGLSVTARDWARWGQMLCTDGRVGSGQVIPGMDKLVKDIRQNPQPGMWPDGKNASEWFSPGTGYRSLTWTAPTRAGQRPVIFAHGAYHQKCYVDPEREFVLVKFSSLDDPGQFYGTDDVAAQSFLDVLPNLVGQ